MFTLEVVSVAGVSRVNPAEFTLTTLLDSYIKSPTFKNKEAFISLPSKKTLPLCPVAIISISVGYVTTAPTIDVGVVNNKQSIAVFTDGSLLDCLIASRPDLYVLLKSVVF